MTILKINDNITEFVETLPLEAHKLWVWSFQSCADIELWVVHNEFTNEYVLPVPLHSVQWRGIYYLKSVDNNTNAINLIFMLEQLNNGEIIV